jgi:hypothetical protein
MGFLFLWMIIAYGISNILVYGSIFNEPRKFINTLAINEYVAFHPFWVFLDDMLKCMMCTSVWVGFFLGAFITSPTENIFEISSYYSWFFDGMFASGSVWAINSIVEWFEENRPDNK